MQHAPSSSGRYYHANESMGMGPWQSAAWRADVISGNQWQSVAIGRLEGRRGWRG